MIRLWHLLPMQDYVPDLHIIPASVNARQGENGHHLTVSPEHRSAAALADRYSPAAQAPEILRSPVAGQYWQATRYPRLHLHGLRLRKARYQTNTNYCYSTVQVD